MKVSPTYPRYPESWEEEEESPRQLPREELSVPPGGLPEAPGSAPGAEPAPLAGLPAVLAQAPALEQGCSPLARASMPK